MTNDAPIAGKSTPNATINAIQAPGTRSSVERDGIPHVPRGRLRHHIHAPVMHMMNSATQVSSARTFVVNPKIEPTWIG